MFTHTRHATIVAYLALFIALGGSSYAAARLAAGSVTTREIRDHTVQPRDLAPAARPPSAGALRTAITDVVTDPATDLNIHVISEKGDRGEKGDTGAPGTAGIDGHDGAQGPQGNTGEKGEKGDTGAPGMPGAAGTIRVYGRVNPDGNGTVVGTTVTHPGVGIYCLTEGNPAMVAVTASPLAPNTTVHVEAPGGTCGAGKFSVVASNGAGQDVGVMFTGA